MDERESQDRLKSILERVTELPSDARGEFLDRECSDDAALRARVEQLLGSHDAAGSFLRSASLSSDSAASMPARDAARREIGPYTLLEPIGEGGFGVVYLAEQHRPIQRKVALKLLRVGGAGSQVFARFDAERQALALMDHPNIAVVHDAGVTEAGDPYFVMEYVAGLPITKFADDQLLTLEERLRLFIQLCEAVQHAHQKGVIHRDLKPSNVLVARTDGKPLVKVIDFGVAKALGARLTEETLHTQHGVVIGTPEYMSPEQASTSPLGVDTRSDVYSLGVILYELLVGSVPFDRREAEGESVFGLLRLIREKQPPKPTTRLQAMGATSEQVATQRQSDVRSLARRIRGDLEWITLKCLEKDPARRYGSAAMLAEDVSRFLENHPIMARPPSTAYHLSKFVARHRAIAAVVSLLVLSLIGFAVTVSVMLGRQRVERLKAEHLNAFLQEMLASADPGKARGSQVLVRDVVDRAAAKVPTELANEPELQLAAFRTLLQTYEGLGLYPETVALAHSAVSVSERLKGSKNSQRGAALSDLGIALRLAGHPDSAVTVLGEAARLLRSQRSDTDDLLRTLTAWAASLMNLGRYDESEKVSREALAILQAAGRRDIHYANTLADYAVTLEKQGRYAEAEAAQRDALTTQRTILGDDHPDVLVGMTNLGILLRKQRKFAEAESVYRAAIATERRVLGDSHPNLAGGLGNLAVLLKSLGRYAEAESLYLECLSIKRRLFGNDHPDVAMVLNNLGTLRTAQGNFEEAERALMEAQSIFQRDPGMDPLNVALASHNLAMLRFAESRFVEAEKLELPALETRVRVLGEAHPDVAACRQALAQILLGQNKPTEARKVMEVCLAGQSGAKRSDPVLLAWSRNLLGQCILREGHPAAAETLLVGSVEPILGDATFSATRKRTVLKSAIEALTAVGKRQEAARFQAQLDSLAAK